MSDVTNGHASRRARWWHTLLAHLGLRAEPRSVRLVDLPRHTLLGYLLLCAAAGFVLLRLWG